MTAFDELMRSLDNPLVVVTTAAGGERAGCLVGFHSQSSMDPGRFVVWLSKANHTYRVGLRADHLAVHLLAEDQMRIAELFGSLSGDDVDKFTRCEWDEGPGGVPLLADCPNRFSARRVALLDEGGDHVCVVTEPVDVSSAGPITPMRLSGARHLRPGHENVERPHPPTERADGVEPPRAEQQ